MGSSAMLLGALLFALLFCCPQLTFAGIEDDDEMMVHVVPKKSSFLMGNSFEDAKGYPNDLPAQTVSIYPFFISATAITNAQFRKFVRETKYKTESENFGWSFVLEWEATDAAKATSTSTVKDAAHWIVAQRAYWRMPFGPNSGISKLLNHPVVQVSYNDAVAYCKWAHKGGRLPREEEWEFAARGGLHGMRYPWGNELKRNAMNVGRFLQSEGENPSWQVSTVAANAFEANNFGLYNVLGNVWEWIRTSREKKVLRGGSFIDSSDGLFNHKVTISTRMENTPDSASTNIGFRCAVSDKDYLASLTSSEKRSRKRYVHPRQAAGGKERGNAPPHQGLDQEMLSKIAEEGGPEALQEYLGALGVGGKVMTPAQLKQMQTEMRARMNEL